MEVYGSEGTLVASGGQVQAARIRVQGARRGDKELGDLEIPADLRWVPQEVPAGTPVNVAQMLRRFAEGIRGNGDPEPTFADAVRNHRLLDAIQAASDSGRAVKIEP
jgi:predicted dehydrogenase